MKTTQIKAIVALFAILSVFLFTHEIQKVRAAGTAVTLSPSALTTSGTATEVTFSYVASGEYGITDLVYITADSGVTVSDCASPTSDADGDTTSDAAPTYPQVGGQTYTYQFGAATTTASTGGVDFCIGFNSATAGNYGISFTDSNGDYGTALLYIGSANQVNVTAQVAPALAFVIRDSTNTTNTNSCDLGALSLTTVESCSYRLKITTNLESGYAVQITSDGGLVSGVNDINAIADNGTITAGTEGYGVELAVGSITGGAIVESSSPVNFGNNDSPIPTSATAFYTTDGPNNPDTNSAYTALVTHQAAMDGSTASGNYTQTVTYTVASNF